jgi:hypothetical protein
MAWWAARKISTLWVIRLPVLVQKASRVLPGPARIESAFSMLAVDMAAQAAQSGSGKTMTLNNA